MFIDTGLADFDPKVFDPIPKGYYDAEIINITQEHASTGTAYLNVEFEILGPTHEGRHMWANIYLTDKARWKLAALVSAAGLGMVDELDTDLLIGKRLRIAVKNIDDPEAGNRSEVGGFQKLKSEDAAA